ncbi:MAG: fumarate hydratase, partial [Erysipelotrichaceae bacterium]
YDIVDGSDVNMTVIAKGFGSENVSCAYMMKPTSTVEEVSQQIIQTIINAGPNACPPFVIGVGIGGTLEKASILAKKATAKTTYHHDQRYADLEKKLETKINQLQIGPLGFKGDLTVLGLRILDFPTHIAGLPVVVNVCCHQSRHKEITL